MAVLRGLLMAQSACPRAIAPARPAAVLNNSRRFILVSPRQSFDVFAALKQTRLLIFLASAAFVCEYRSKKKCEADAELHQLRRKKDMQLLQKVMRPSN
ncbi:MULTISPECIES: hypothetical protein [Acidobacterium]|uniref:hypothetical protein n=1 Tax=Acidobacterium TaxID=33973 RepID=UPI00145EA7C2|nr:MULTISPECIES: hypothetical protein [Acidobacterium]